MLHSLAVPLQVLRLDVIVRLAGGLTREILGIVKYKISNSCAIIDKKNEQLYSDEDTAGPAVTSTYNGSWY